MRPWGATLLGPGHAGFVVEVGVWGKVGAARQAAPEEELVISSDPSKPPEHVINVKIMLYEGQI